MSSMHARLRRSFVGFFSLVLFSGFFCIFIFVLALLSKTTETKFSITRRRHPASLRPLPPYPYNPATLTTSPPPQPPCYQRSQCRPTRHKWWHSYNVSTHFSGLLVTKISEPALTQSDHKFVVNNHIATSQIHGNLLWRLQIKFACSLVLTQILFHHVIFRMHNLEPSFIYALFCYAWAFPLWNPFQADRFPF